MYIVYCNVLYKQLVVNASNMKLTNT